MSTNECNGGCLMERVEWDLAKFLLPHPVALSREKVFTADDCDAIDAGERKSEADGFSARKFVGCVNCVDFTSKTRREQNLVEAAKIEDGWKGTVDKDKEIINKVFTDKLQPLIDGNRENALVVTLDGPNLYTTSCLVRNAGLPSKNISVPAPFNGKHHKTAKKRGNQDLKDTKIWKLFLYDLILELDADKPLVGIFLDYCGTFTGNKYARPLLDIELLFRRQLLCSIQFPEAYLMVTFCARNPKGGAVGLGGRYGETTLPIVELGLTHGYIVTQCYTHAYGSAMYVIGYYVRSFRFPTTIGYRLSPGGINSKLTFLSSKSKVSSSKPTKSTKSSSAYLYPEYDNSTSLPSSSSSSLSLTSKRENQDDQSDVEEEEETSDTESVESNESVDAESSDDSGYESGDDEKDEDYEGKKRDEKSLNAHTARTTALAKLADQTSQEIARTVKSNKSATKSKKKLKCKMEVLIKGKKGKNGEDGKNRFRECKKYSTRGGNYCCVHEPEPASSRKRKYDVEDDLEGEDVKTCYYYLATGKKSKKCLTAVIKGSNFCQLHSYDSSSSSNNLDSVPPIERLAKLLRHEKEQLAADAVDAAGKKRPRQK